MLHLSTRRFCSDSRDQLNPPPNTLEAPPTEATEYTVPIPERFRQITPGRARTHDPKHAFPEHPVVFGCRAPSMRSASNVGARRGSTGGVSQHPVSPLSQNSRTDWQRLQIVAYCPCPLGHGLLCPAVPAVPKGQSQANCNAMRLKAVAKVPISGVA